jgi:hypothetical protein
MDARQVRQDASANSKPASRPGDLCIDGPTVPSTSSIGLAYRSTILSTPGIASTVRTRTMLSTPDFGA